MKNSRFYLVSAFIVLAVVSAIIIGIYFLTCNYLVIKSGYNGYEAGYEDVLLKPEVFCSTEMKDPTKADIESELITNEANYEYKEETRKAMTKDKEYLYEGRYKIDVILGGQREGVVLSVYDTQPPIFLNIMKNLIVEQGMTTEDLAMYFPIQDFDDQTTLVLFLDDINLNKPQKTKATVVAHDSHGNLKELEINLEILSHKDAKKNSKKLSKKFTEQLTQKVKIEKNADKESYIKKLNEKREQYLQKEANLAKQLGADNPDFSRCDEMTKEIQDKVDYRDFDEVLNDVKEEKTKETEKNKETKDSEENNNIINTNETKDNKDNKDNNDNTNNKSVNEEYHPNTLKAEPITPEKPNQLVDPTPERPDDTLDESAQVTLPTYTITAPWGTHFYKVDEGVSRENGYYTIDWKKLGANITDCFKVDNNGTLVDNRNGTIGVKENPVITKAYTVENANNIVVDPTYRTDKKIEVKLSSKAYYTTNGDKITLTQAGMNLVEDTLENTLGADGIVRDNNGYYESVDVLPKNNQDELSKTGSYHVLFVDIYVIRDKITKSIQFVPIYLTI